MLADAKSSPDPQPKQVALSRTHSRPSYFHDEVRAPTRTAEHLSPAKAVGFRLTAQVPEPLEPKTAHKTREVVSKIVTKTVHKTIKTKLQVFVLFFPLTLLVSC